MILNYLIQEKLYIVFFRKLLSNSIFDLKELDKLLKQL